MTERSDRFLNALLTAAAITIAAVVVRREFFAGTPARAETLKPEFVPEWKDFLSSGRLVGNTEAGVKIVEFSDLECPFCKAFHASVRAIMKERPDQVAFTFIHYPLDNHRFARPAARALECAPTEADFAQLLDLLYAKQDSLGLKAWTAYAADAGIVDTAAFARCTADTARVEAIEVGVALGERLGVHLTPTILLNGWRYHGGMPQAQLDAVIKRLLAGKNPS